MDDVRHGQRNRCSNAVKVGSYTLRKVIGRGNFAVVKLGKHEVTKTKVAVKIVDKCRIDDDNLRKIYREIQILKTLKHPHVVRLYQVMETDSKLFLVTEYASGGEVFEFLQKHGRMSERQARHVFRQSVAAVAFCHMSGIVHRDLKAENLLLDADNNVKLVDFGFSNFYHSDQLLSTWCGSPPYAAPELFLGASYDGTKADVWSLGVVLYILVSGGFPFPSNSMERLKQAVLLGNVNIPFYVSVECADLIRRMLVVDPNQRFNVRQIVQHKWFCADDWNESWQALLRDSFVPKVNNENHELNHTVAVFMQQKGYNADRVAEAVIEKRFDDDYATYHLLCDKLFSEKFKNHRIANGIPDLTSDLPRRGSRGSLTTGQANIELANNETNTISAVDLVKLSVGNADEGLATSDSDEGSSGEATPYNLQTYLSQRRHTAIGVPGVSGCQQPPALLTASGHIGVPFPLAFGLGEVSNLANIDSVPHTLPLSRLLEPRFSHTGVAARRGSDGAAGFAQQPFDFVSLGQTASAATFFAAAAANMHHAGVHQTSGRMQSRGSSGGGDDGGGEEAIEEAGARYLRVRGGSKRHTVHGQSFSGGSSAAGRDAAIGFGRQAPMSAYVRHSRGDPYRPVSSHRRGSDSTPLTPQMLTHLERLYNQATHRPESPAGGEGMRQLQYEFQQLRASTEMTQTHQQLLQSGSVDQPWRSPRSSPPGQSLDMIVEHDSETNGFGPSPPNCHGVLNRVTADSSAHNVSSTPQINVTDDRGTTVVHRPPGVDTTASPASLSSLPLPFRTLPMSIDGIFEAQDALNDPISKFQQFAQGLLLGEASGACLGRQSQQAELEQQQQRLIRQQQRQQTLSDSGPVPTAHPMYPYVMFAPPVIGGTVSNGEQGVESSYLCSRTVSSIILELKHVLDKLNVAYKDLATSGENYSGGSDGLSRRVSLESDDGTKIEIDVAQLDQQTGLNKVDFRCVQGDYSRYKELCGELMAALQS